MSDWDFSANQEVDEETLGKAPEGYRGAYAKDEATGKYKIADTHRPFVDAITGLGTALKAERNVSRDLKGRKDIAAVVKETFGFETVEEAKAKWDEMSQTIATNGKVDPAKIKADIEKTFNAEKQGLLDENQGMQNTLRKYMVEAAAATALGAAKGNSKLLMPIVREAVDLVKDGDDWVVRVKDGQGDYRGNGKGGFMTVEDFVNELKGSKEYGVAFESDMQGGGGDRSQRPGQGQRQQHDRQQNNDNMSATDRISRGLANRRGR